jgi:hypothetical protein
VFAHKYKKKIFVKEKRSNRFVSWKFYLLSLFDTMLNFVVNLLENERDPRQDQ